MFGGSFSGLGTESKAIVGTAYCANADGAINSISPASQCLISSSPDICCSCRCPRMLVDGCSVCMCPPRHDHHPSLHSAPLHEGDSPCDPPLHVISNLPLGFAPPSTI